MGRAAAPLRPAHRARWHGVHGLVARGRVLQLLIVIPSPSWDLLGSFIGLRMHMIASEASAALFVLAECALAGGDAIHERFAIDLAMSSCHLDCRVYATCFLTALPAVSVVASWLLHSNAVRRIVSDDD